MWKIQPDKKEIIGPRLSDRVGVEAIRGLGVEPGSCCVRVGQQLISAVFAIESNSAGRRGHKVESVLTLRSLYPRIWSAVG